MFSRIPGAAAAPPLARQLTAGAVLLAVVLAGLAAWAGAGTVRVTFGVVLAVAGAAVLVRAARAAGARSLGPAGSVTLARGVLVIGAATLVGLDGAGQVALIALALIALALDLVDGPVARRTGTATALGARFDMETDAALLLVLSVHVAAVSGTGWVVALGLLRYAYAAAGRVLPWLDGELPVRRSAKVVAAVQGVVLVVAAARVLPPALERAALVLALAALLWSFGTSVAHRWRVSDEHPFRRRAAVSGLLNAVAAVLVGTILVLPADPLALEPLGFVRLPLEFLVGAAVLAVLPARPRRVVAVVAGVVLALLGVLKLLDIGFRTFLDRPFDPVSDRVLLGNAREFVRGAAGEAGAVVATIGAGLAVVALLVATAWAVARLGGVAARYRTVTLRGAAVLGTAWLVIWAAAGGQPAPGAPVAADGVAALRDRAAAVPASLRDDRAFAAELARDPFADAPAGGLLTALRGKDVVFAVVESYGRSAVEDPAMAPRIDPVLADGDRDLGAAGFSSRSGFLTAPISGGGSWLAHATLFSGLRIDDQRRHERLTTSDRLTLTRAFRDAGWETTAVMPGTTREWPEASFYGHQRVHGLDGLGYAGPPFSWSPMPDQYALSAFSRLEYDRPGRGPLMAEIALTSSHAPWTPVPPVLPWEEIGDGSVYAPHAQGQRTFDSVFSGDTAGIREDYLDALGYSLESLLGWIERSGDAGPDNPDDLVVVLLGDHQPVAAVTGPDASRDVPVSVVTRDREVLDRVAEWGWTPGLKPPPDAPVWPMERFRDRFLETFGR